MHITKLLGGISMEELLYGAQSIIVIIVAIILLVLYHSVFNVYYFSGKGCLLELFVVFCIAALIVGLGGQFIALYWKQIIGVIAILIILSVIFKK